MTEIMRSLDIDLAMDTNPKGIVISGIPLPPSDNGQYKSIITKSTTSRTGYQSKRVASDAYVKYKRKFEDWALLNMQLIVKARKALHSWNSYMELELLFAMEEGRILTLENYARKMDVQNRDKAITDALSAALRIDDSMFNRTTQEKVIAAPNGEQVIAIIKPKKLRTLSAVYESLEVKLI